MFRCFFFFSSRRRHTRYWRDWSSDVCSSDLHHRRGCCRASSPAAMVPAANNGPAVRKPCMHDPAAELRQIASDYKAALEKVAQEQEGLALHLAMLADELEG